MSWFSRMRGNSHAQLETPEDEKYPEGKGGVLKAKTADFVLNKGEKLGIHLTDNNIITKIDAGSIAERDANFKVGDTIVAVNGESADGLEVAEMIKDMDAVSLTVTRKRNSVRVSNHESPKDRSESWPAPTKDGDDEGEEGRQAT